MILGTIDDVHLLNGYPDCLISDIISVLSVLDDNYGSDRKIFEDIILTVMMNYRKQVQLNLRKHYLEVIQK